MKTERCNTTGNCRTCAGVWVSGVAGQAGAREWAGGVGTDAVSWTVTQVCPCWTALVNVYSYISPHHTPLLITIIIMQRLYSALKSCKGYGGAGGFRLRLSEQVCFEVFLKVCKVWQDLTSDGSEFQVCGAATENARRANSVLLLTDLIPPSASPDTVSSIVFTRLAHLLSRYPLIIFTLKTPFSHFGTYTNYLLTRARNRLNNYRIQISPGCL